MKTRPKQQPHTEKSAGGSVDVKQRRALARLGLATVSAYAAPMLLALRSPARDRKAAERVEFAA